MTSYARDLATEVQGLMRMQADLLDQLERARRDARRERDALLLAILEVMDSSLRALDLVEDEQARGVLVALERQVELVFAGAGMATYSFQPGVVPPLAEIDVVGTQSVPGMPDLAVVRTVQPGLRDNERILRRAAVEVNKTAMSGGD